MTHSQRELFGIKIDALDMQQAVQQVRLWVSQKQAPCRYVVTPNVDHAVLLRTNRGLQKAYESADLVLADGHPIVWASRILGQPVPERVPGSDLVPELFTAANGLVAEQMANQMAANQKSADPPVAQAESCEPLTVFLLGAAPGVGRRACENMKIRWPNVRTVGVYSPPLGFQDDPAENDYILGRIALSRPDILVVGLGAPKQECWVHEHRDQIQASVALCVGATIDFLAGEKSRAPAWMQKTGTEWLHRMCTDPRRLVKRYARDAWVFPQLVMQQWVSSRSQRPAG